MPAIGELVRKLREERGWTLRDLAERMELTHAAVSRKERGDISIKPPERLRFAEVFGLSLDEFDARWRASKVHDRPAPPGIPVINAGPAGQVMPYDHAQFAGGEYHDAFAYEDRDALTREGELYAVRVVGDSMAPAIRESDILVFAPMTTPRPRHTLEPGDVVFVRVGDDAKHPGCTVGRWFPDGATTRIVKINPAHREISIATEHITQLGKMIQHRKGWV